MDHVFQKNSCRRGGHLVRGPTPAQRISIATAFLPAKTLAQGRIGLSVFPFSQGSEVYLDGISEVFALHFFGFAHLAKVESEFFQFVFRIKGVHKYICAFESANIGTNFYI